MSYQNIASDLFIELSHQQQEFITGGVNFQSNDSNFDQSFLKKTMNNTKEGQNNISTTTTEFADYRNSAESSLSSDTLANSPLAALNKFTPTSSSSVALP